MRVLPKPVMPKAEWSVGPLPSVLYNINVPGSRLYGAARINGVVFWYYPPDDLLVRADKWLDIVGDPDAVEGEE